MEYKTVSRLLLALLLLSTLMLASDTQLARATGTIYIRPDGTVEGTDKIHRDGAVYTFTDDISDRMVVETDNIVVDGSGYTLQGTGTGSGIDLTGRSDIALRNVTITAFKWGIYLHDTSNISISENSIRASDYGILLGWSSDHTIFGNSITTDLSGIWLVSSPNNRISENYITCETFEVSIHDSSYNNVSGNTITTNGYGISIGNNASNSISGNTIAAGKAGITLGYTSSNNICGNNITVTKPSVNAIRLTRASHNILIGNILESNTYVIGLADYSDHNIVTGNTITGRARKNIPIPESSYGIAFHLSSHNSITENNITNTDYAISLGFSSSDNKFYHNNFINNTNVVADWFTESNSVWDDGYPSGGNYWSDYEKRYPDARELFYSGIWDTPYVVDGDNQDNYPLMHPWSPEASAEVPFWRQWWFWTTIVAGITLSAGAVYFFRKRKPPKPPAPPLSSEAGTSKTIQL